MLKDQDLGESLYKTWSNKQRRDEITKLVQGYRSGLPIGILCKMTEAIAGSRKRARAYLQELLTLEERQNALAGESESMHAILKEFLL